MDSAASLSRRLLDVAGAGVVLCLVCDAARSVRNTTGARLVGSRAIGAHLTRAVDQLALAREKSLYNRRQKLKVKLEIRLAELRSKLGYIHDDQLERVVKHLIETEDHHRSKLNDHTEHFNKKLNDIHNSLHTISKMMVHRGRSAKSTATLSDVSSLSRM